MDNQTLTVVRALRNLTDADLAGIAIMLAVAVPTEFLAAVEQQRNAMSPEVELISAGQSNVADSHVKFYGGIQIITANDVLFKLTASQWRQLVKLGEHYTYNKDLCVKLFQEFTGADLTDAKNCIEAFGSQGFLHRSYVRDCTCEVFLSAFKIKYL